MMHFLRRYNQVATDISFKTPQRDIAKKVLTARRAADGEGCTGHQSRPTDRLV